MEAFEETMRNAQKVWDEMIQNAEFIKKTNTEAGLSAEEAESEYHLIVTAACVIFNNTYKKALKAYNESQKEK